MISGTNFHVDAIAGFANPRARSYAFHIATSTAMEIVIIYLELYKVLDGGHKIDEDNHIEIPQISIYFMELS